MQSLDDVFRSAAEILVARVESLPEGPWAAAGFRWEDLVEPLARGGAKGEVRIWPAGRQEIETGRAVGEMTLQAGRGRFPDEAPAGLGAAVLLWIDRSPAEFQETAAAIWRRLRPRGLVAGLGLVPDLPIPLRRILRAALEPTGLRLKPRATPSAFDDADGVRASLARSGFPMPRAWVEPYDVRYLEVGAARHDLRRAGTGDLESAIRTEEGRTTYREGLERELKNRIAEGSLTVRWQVVAFIGEKEGE